MFWRGRRNRIGHGLCRMHAAYGGYARNTSEMIQMAESRDSLPSHPVSEIVCIQSCFRTIIASRRHVDPCGEIMGSKMAEKQAGRIRHRCRSGRLARASGPACMQRTEQSPVVAVDLLAIRPGTLQSPGMLQSCVPRRLPAFVGCRRRRTGPDGYRPAVRHATVTRQRQSVPSQTVLGSP